MNMLLFTLNMGRKCSSNFGKENPTNNQIKKLCFTFKGTSNFKALLIVYEFELCSN